jgi:hypothetical protein
MQDRCAVCAEHIIGLKIIMDVSDGTCFGHEESCFGPIGDSVSVGAI